MSTKTADKSTIWGDRPMPAGRKVQRLDVGPLTLWFKGLANEVWIAFRRGDGQPAGDDETPPGDLDWSRWALGATPHHLRLLPVLPDRLIVVKPEHPFTLLRKAEARVYTRLPAWVRVEAVEQGRSEGSVLMEIPTEILSDTWWGDFLTGEMGYWLTTKARRELRPELFEPHMIMSALQLVNRSDDALPVEKLAWRVEHLSTYDKDGQLWAEETKVYYLGEAEGSDIHMEDKPPAEAAGAREISPARAPQVRGLRARTFLRLRAFSGW
jgi:hypothetical protein